MKKIIKNKNEAKNITSRNEDFSQWYIDIIETAELAEHGPVKGTMIIKPHGYAIWEFIQKNLDEKIKETGVVNAYFPLLIPEHFLRKEKEHVEGFSPEIVAATYAGGKRLKEALIIRPTSETIMYDAFSRWVRSHNDLPILINQWANVIRWEIRPRLFLRSTEFLWQEGHTVHASIEEADQRARMMLVVYEKFMEDFLAIPVVTGQKTDNEKFAGASKTYAIEAMTQNGKALQLATSHNLGFNFAKVFGLEFTNKDGETAFCAQTSWGLSTRTIGGIIMLHGDDVGLILPPKVAPIQIVVIPIWPNEKEKDSINKIVIGLETELKDYFRMKSDFEDSRPGEKFFKWERKGVPIRIEIGPKDIQNNCATVVRRDLGKKSQIPFKDLKHQLEKMLDDIQTNLYNLSLTRLKNNTVEVDSWDDFLSNIEQKKFVLAHWCGKIEIEKKIKKETGATIRCIPFNQKVETGKCIYSGEPSTQRVLFAKSY
jgi:prolyl-tRNA synthetase